MKIEWTLENCGGGDIQHEAEVTFDIVDVKGRKLGFWMKIDPTQPVWEWSDAEGKSVIARRGIFGRSQQLRNGESFGASQTWTEYPSVEAAKADLEKKALAAGKRYAAKAAKNGGTYL